MRLELLSANKIWYFHSNNKKEATNKRNCASCGYIFTKLLQKSFVLGHNCVSIKDADYHPFTLAERQNKKETIMYFESCNFSMRGHTMNTW